MNPRRKNFVVPLGLLISAALTWGSYRADGAVSNLAGDFSTTSNPNGVWSYGYLSSNASFSQDANNLAFLETGALPAGSPGFVPYNTFNGGGVGGGGGWTGGLGFPFAGHWGVPTAPIVFSDGLTDWPSSAGDNVNYPNGVVGGHSPTTPFTTGWYAIRYTASSSGPVDLSMQAWQTSMYPNVPPNPTFGGATRTQQIRIDKVVGSTRTSLVRAPHVTRHGVINRTGTPEYTALNAPNPGAPNSYVNEIDEINAALRSSANPNLYRLTNVNLNAGESIVISYAPMQGLNFAGFHALDVTVRTGADRIATTRWDLSDDFSLHGSTATGIGPDAAWSYGILSGGSFAPYNRLKSGFTAEDVGTVARESHGWGTPEPGWFLNGVADPAEGPITPGMMKDSDGFNLAGNIVSGQYIGANGDWGGGKVALHTPTSEVDADQTSVIRWTAPRTMSVDVDGGLWRLTLPDATDRRHEYELRRGLTVLASGTIDELGFGVTDTNSVNPEAFSLSNLAVTAGDILELRISPLSTGGGTVTADFDNSGTVDGGDLTVWQGAYGINGDGDADGDGDSDGRDFLTWQREFGMVGGTNAEAGFIGVDFTVQESAGALVSVPEPCSIVMLLAGIGACWARRK